MKTFNSAAMTVLVAVVAGGAGCGPAPEGGDAFDASRSSTEELRARRWVMLWQGRELPGVWAAQADGARMTCADGSVAYLCRVAASDVASGASESAAALFDELSQHPLLVSATIATGRSAKSWLKVYRVTRGYNAMSPLQEYPGVDQPFGPWCYALNRLTTSDVAGCTPESANATECLNYTLRGLNGDSTSRTLRFLNVDGLSFEIDDYGDAPREFLAEVDASLHDTQAFMACGMVVEGPNFFWLPASQIFR